MRMHIIVHPDVVMCLVMVALAAVIIVDFLKSATTVSCGLTVAM